MNGNALIRSLQVTMSLMLVGCSDSQSRIATVVSQEETERRLEYYNKHFQASDVCDDFKLLKEIMSQIQYSSQVDSTPLLQRHDCPQAYSDLAQMVHSSFQALSDFHLRASYGSGIDGESPPIVKSCSDEELCAIVKGAPIIPLESPGLKQQYALVPDTKGSLHAFEIMQVGGVNVEKYVDEAVKNHSISHSLHGTYSNISAYILLRNTIDVRSKSDLSLVLRRLGTNDIENMVVSYDDIQEVFHTMSQSQITRLFSAPRQYGCEKVLEGSDAMHGSCFTKDKQGVLWIGQWTKPTSFVSTHDFIEKSLLFLNKEGAKSRIYLDLRGNPGGDSKEATLALCQLGNEATLASMNSLTLETRVWPEFFDLGEGAVVRSESIEKRNNIDLVRTEKGRSVGYETSPVTYQQSFLNRFGITPALCQAERNPLGNDYRWTIMTIGSEFSATENFLVVAKRSGDKFTIVGHTTSGGTGNPVWVELPKTKLRVRLSQSRLRESSEGSFLIEGEGISPDIDLEFQDASHFEESIVHQLSSGIMDGPDYPGILLSKIP